MDLKKYPSIAKLLKILQILKFIALLTCIGAFGWKVYDSHKTYMKEETGTNIGILPIRKAPQTNYALCRNPGQIFGLFDGLQGDLKSDFNLTISQMNLLQAYELIEQKGKKYEEVFESFLFRDPRSLRNVTVVERGDRSLDDGYFTNFDCSSKDFSVFVHPIFGFCLNFLNSNLSPSGINYLRMEINLEFAFPSVQSTTQVNFNKRNKRENKENDLSQSKLESSQTERSQLIDIELLAQGSHLETLSPNAGTEPATPTTEETTTTSANTNATIQGAITTQSSILDIGGFFPDGDHSDVSVGEIMSDELFFGNGVGVIDAPFYFNFPQDQEYRYQESGFGLINVIAFSPGQFLTSKNLLRVSYETGDYYTMQHVVVDKVRIRHVQECEADKTFDEDSCLYACLVEKFVAKFKCFHARLMFIKSYPKPDDVPYCDFESLYRKLADADYTNETTDPGTDFIQKTLDAFEVDTDESNRCHCPHPCIKQRTRFQTWKSVRTDAFKNNTFAVLKYGEDFKVYSYHMLYNGNDFLADIGGYMGLFLGLSVFGLVDLISKVFNCKKEEDEQSNKVEDDSLRDVNGSLQRNQFFRVSRNGNRAVDSTTYF